MRCDIVTVVTVSLGSSNILAEYFEKGAAIAMWYLEQVLELSNMVLCSS